jgi:hypothetical protein
MRWGTTDVAHDPERGCGLLVLVLGALALFVGGVLAGTFLASLVT